ncbi:SDR family oxidoreductase [Herbiconiux moechotypicola]|uniref:SDR family NAD(P)-dependent oxidoreductase n=1 Tax=Herbiconiux moechotypicola TaxID=637393 RepID=A0ABP5QWU4_9MICO|nr:SDR family oxidoreductase [Herbiconiux moechotypicola]MCS5730853.1 SDR family oxidoreductase [Herbiconiux moechotypicola]
MRAGPAGGGRMSAGPAGARPEAVVVTGAGSGIGRAIAERFAADGARVLAADIDLAAAERVAEAIGGHAARVDVSSQDGVRALAGEAERLFGGVDVLVSNAGVASTGRLDAMTDADWAWLLGVNLYGTAHTVQEFLPLVRRAGGRILVTGSVAGFAPDVGMGGYGVTKAAITAYAEVLADELAGEGISVTLLAPGPVRTALGSSSRNRPASGGAAGLVDVDLSAGDGGGLPWLAPEEVANIAVQAVRAGRRYAVTHPGWLEPVIARHRRIEAAFGPDSG